MFPIAAFIHVYTHTDPYILQVELKIHVWDKTLSVCLFEPCYLI